MKITRLFGRTFLMCLFVVAASHCASPAASTPGTNNPTLTFEEYPLDALECAADPEARCFVPSSGSFEEVMAKRGAERALPPGEKAGLEKNELSTFLDGKTLTASIITAQSDERPEIVVQVALEGETIFTRPLGPPSPVYPLQGLWVNQGHWVLEVVENVSTGEFPTSVGVIVQDGQVIGESQAYDETFGFALPGGKPFYFFLKDGAIGVSFDGQIMTPGYQLVPHYGCCSAARLNPQEAEDMISFFAQRDGSWYYVEAGVYP